MSTLIDSAAAAATAAELVADRAPDVGLTVTGGEHEAQAAAGLTMLHGDADGTPRAVRLPVASVAAGVLAAQGTLAAQSARARGSTVTAVETSTLGGALMYASHHVAVGDLPGRGRHPTSPPFRSADGCWFELEATGFDAWAALWGELGATHADVAEGWASFAPRYVTGICGLPTALHECARARHFAAIEACAERHGVAAIRVRDAARAGVPVWRLVPGAHAEPVRRLAPPVDRPLAGVFVVELTSRLQGPLAGRLLHLLGADVLKIEPPGGDPGRLAPGGPFRGAYLAYNHGKRFVELDYRTSDGREELASRVAAADVFLHNARPGRAERYGFDAGRLTRRNPGLVHVGLAGWDHGANRGDTVAGDYVVQADSGVAAALAGPDEPPRPSPLTLLDVLGGLLGATAAVAGLVDRDRTGRGTCATTTLAGAAALLLRHGRGAEVTGNRAAPSPDPDLGALLVEVGDGILAAGAPWRFA